MSKTKEEQLIFEYVLYTQMLKRGATMSEQYAKEKVAELAKKIDLSDENVNRRCISVSKGIVHRRNSMYKTMFEKALSEADAKLVESYVYQCIGNDVDPEVKDILSITLL